MKNTFKIIGIVILILILFRGTTYRLIVKYSSIGTRPNIELIDKKLIEAAKSSSSGKTINIEEIAKIANYLTSENLNFTSNALTNDPNKLSMSNRANCIGYSAMFNSISNFLIDEYKLRDKIKSEHHIGKLEILGIDIHKFITNPFFKDHDYNKIVNLQTRESITLDPSVSDYLGINWISEK